MTIISKKFNADRSALRATAKTNELHTVTAVTGGWIVEKVTPKAAPAAIEPEIEAAAPVAIEPEPTRTMIDQSERDRRKIAKLTPMTNAAAKPAGKRAAAQEAAQAGIMPSAPDFSAATHKPYRAKLELLKTLAAAGQIEGLKAVTINATSSSPKALEKYRDLAIIAISAARNQAA